jgi:hypothetical protein
LPGNFVQISKLSLTDLLFAAVLIQIHSDVGFFSLKVSRRIVEFQVSILADADKSRVDLLLRNYFTDALTLLNSLRTVTINQVKCAGMYVSPLTSDSLKPS